MAAAAVRVALLVNLIAPYRLALLERLRDRVGRLRIFVSTAMEPNRDWTPEWGSLDVVVQRTVTLERLHDRPGGISHQLYIHVPYDALPLLLAYDPQIVISGEMGARSLQAALYRRLLRPRRTRLILWATLSDHTESVKSWGLTRRLLRRFLVRAADAVIVNGRSGARYIARLDPACRVHIMNQPVDTALFAGAPLDRGPEAARRLVYSGRLVTAKGVFELQRALAERARRRPDQEIEMVWAGEGDARPALAAQALPGNVRQRFTGHLDYPELARIYAECGALVLPTLFDEWGLVVNEAMASGLPVLGSIYSQAVEEMVEEGQTGWLFDPLRPESLTTALDRFLDAPAEQLAAMRARARARGLSITPDGAADRIVAAIGAVTAVPRRWTWPAATRRRADAAGRG